MKKPWFWKARKAWFVSDGKTQIRLHEDEEKAYKLWQEMQASGNPLLPFASLDSLAENYLMHCKRNVSQGTYERYSRYVADFGNFENKWKVAVREIRIEHAYRWLEARQAWGAWTRRGAIAAVKQMFAWGQSQGIVERNPLADLKRPQAERRDTLIDDKQHAAMMERARHGNASRLFRQVLIALRHSGARPGTIAAVTAEDVSPLGDAWVIAKHKTRGKTGKPLVVYLSPCLQTLTRILQAARGGGVLFTNANHEPWTRNAIRCRMRQLRKALGFPPGVVAYSYRHTFATKALVGGTDIATVAELLGHTDTTMVSRHYGHLDQAKGHLKKAAAGVITPRNASPEIEF